MVAPMIFVIGGTGAQGIPVVRGLVSDDSYAVRVLTRDTESRRAKLLTDLSPSVELLQGNLTSEASLRAGLKDCYGAFVNIDGFTTGEKVEMFWAIRIYELAIESGVKFFVFSSLEYGYKLGAYDPKYRTGHYDGKGRIAEWILSQHASNKGKPFYNMRVATFTTGPYIEMTTALGTPVTPSIEQDETGENQVVWRLPLTNDGAIAHVSLDDCEQYVRWLFDNQERADGMDLAVAIEHVHYADLAAAFERVTGHKARFVDVSFEEYWKNGPMNTRGDNASGVQVKKDDSDSMTVRENFTGFWHLWRDSGYNKGLIKRDYGLLDEIHPKRIRSAEEYFQREEEKAKQRGMPTLWDRVTSGAGHPLKIAEDRMKNMTEQREGPI
ncbi:NAD(P)-binding protein [Trichoderma sp. TUCIM 5745]